MVAEDPPGRVGGQVDGAPLFVSVTEAPQAAEQVAQMGDGDYRVVLRRVGYIVMPFDDFGDCGRQLPGLG